jgi:hypothetical protein
VQTELQQGATLSRVAALQDHLENEMEDLSGPLGRWNRDDLQLPCFDLQAPAQAHPYAPLKHLIASGRLSAFADRWGNLSLFTTEGGCGYLDISRNAHLCRSGLYMMVRFEGQLVSLIPDQWYDRQRTRYGCGYAQYTGQIDLGEDLPLGVEQAFYAPAEPEPFLHGLFRIENRSQRPLDLEWVLASDVSLVDNYRKVELEQVLAEDATVCLEAVHDTLGDIYLVADDDRWQGTAVSLVAMGLTRSIRLEPGRQAQVSTCVGYGRGEDRRRAAQRAAQAAAQSPAASWAQVVKPSAPAGEADWVRDECIWTFGQLLSFTNYDSSLEEFYVSLGGYGWRGFNQRELGEVSMVLSGWRPGLARSNLRYMAKTQWSNGDMPKGHDFRKREKQVPPPEGPDCSDPEIWFLLGATTVALEGDEAFLEEIIAWSDGGEVSLWEHLVKAFEHIRDEIGTGPRGLLRFVRGDWNDYLGPMGAKGRGESMMNSGMACRAYDQFAQLCRRRGLEQLERLVRYELESLREAVAACFDETHFLRGFTDDGLAVGNRADGRVFLNAQSWPVLGGCGREDQQRTALRTALNACKTQLGLCLVSKPYPSPPPADIAHCPIPAGEGENGGVWPQTVAWMVWALAEAGLTQEAREVWQRMTLRHHYKAYPDVPFGVFNGPDCYNSHLAGPLAHWTQVQLWDRRVHTPMNPAVAWQAFAMRKIVQAESGPAG